MAQSEITIKIESKMYGRRLALAVARVLSFFGVSERLCTRIAMGVVFVRMRIGGKYTIWKRLNSITDGTN